MGSYLEPGHVYADGQTITGPSLTEHVADALLKTTAISEQLLKDSADATDELLINDGDTFKKITLQILKEMVGRELTIDDLSDELRNQLRTPVGSILDFAGTAAPDGWLFCYGQEISRETYEDLFTAIGTTYGAPTSNTFRVPDCRGRVAAGKDDMGGTSAARLNTMASTTLGTGGGAQTHSHVLTEAQMPSHIHNIDHRHYALQPGYPGATTGTFGASYTFGTTAPTSYMSAIEGHGNSVAAGGNGAHTHNIVQPTIVFNKIIRAL